MKLKIIHLFLANINQIKIIINNKDYKQLIHNNSFQKEKKGLLVLADQILRNNSLVHSLKSFSLLMVIPKANKF